MAKKKRRSPPPQGASRIVSCLQVDCWLPWLIAAAAVIVFGRALRFEFVHWDDQMFVSENPLMNPVTWEGFLGFWLRDHFGFYFPVTLSVWALIAKFLGLNAGRFHAVNLALHGLNTVLVYQVVRQLLVSWQARADHGGRRQPAPETLFAGRVQTLSALAACGALLFAFHPLQVENVSWVSGMKDLLPTCFALLAIRSHFSTASPPRGRDRFLPRSTAWFLLAVLSKPSAVILGPVVVVLDILIRGTAWRTAFMRCSAWFLIALPIAVITQQVQPSSMLYSVAPIWLRPFVAADALYFYIVKLFAPLGFTPEYGRTPEWLLQSGSWKWSWLVPAIVGAAVIWAAWRRRYAPLGLFMAFVLSLAPVLGLVPFLYQKWSTVADHYMYLPMLVVSLAVSLLLAEIAPARRTIAVVAVLVITGGLAALSFAHQPVWGSDDTLFPYAIEHSPRSALLRMNYGESLFERGRYEESLVQFQEAAEIRPHSDVYRNIGSAQAMLGRYGEAKSSFERALSLNPSDPYVIDSLERLKQVPAR